MPAEPSSPKVAREALHRVVAREPRDGDGLLLESAVTTWEGFIDYDARYDCLECGRPASPFFPAEHYPVCQDHPALVRERALRDATTLASTMSGVVTPTACGAETIAPQGPRHFPAGSRYDLQSALRCLMAARPGDPAEIGNAQARLETMLSEWEHVVDRASDPCPLCSGVFPLKDMGQHIRSCRAHPAYGRGDELEAILRRSVGAAAEPLVELVAERNRFRDELRRLVRACAAYEQEWGWDGENAYSKKWCEQPWLTAISRANRLVESARPRPGDPPLTASEGEWLVGVAAKLRGDADRLAAALAKLVGHCRTFWSGMGDGDRGKSIIYKWGSSRWDEARKEASVVLTEVGGA